MTNAKERTKTLTACAIMAAMACVLAMFPVFKLPNGGSVTLASMVPIIFVSLKYGNRWGLITGAVFCAVQMMTGFYPPPTPTLINFFLLIALDYIIPFMLLGTARLFSDLFGGGIAGASFGAFCVTLLRFASHFFSGIILWQAYCPEEQAVWFYSLTVNGSYMIPEIIISTVATCVLAKFFLSPKQTA